MEPLIRRLILKRFRSIPTEAVDLVNPTFLVGRNGSGKSNLVDAFAFLAEAMTSPLRAVFDRRGGIAVVRNRPSGKGYPPNLGLGVEVGPQAGEVSRAHYAFEIRALKNHDFEVVREQCIVEMARSQAFWFDRRRDTFRSNLPGLKPSVEPSALALPLVGGEARLAPVLRTLAAMRTYSIHPARMREMQDPDPGRTLRSDGGNAASVLQEIQRQSREDARRICELLAAVVPHTTQVRPVKHGNKLSIEFTQEWGNKRTKFEPPGISDGTLRALGLLAAVYQPDTPSLIVVEEPEMTVHPGAVGAILDLLRHAGRKMQLVVTTHSPDVLDAGWLSGDQIRIVDWQEGATRITPLSGATRQVLRDHLESAGELFRANALRAAPISASGSPQPSLFEDLAA